MSLFTRENGFVTESGLGYDHAQLNRLNARYRTFLAPNSDRLRGQRVLDLASHDGRWSYAALVNGADRVTGIEARGELIGKADYILDAELRRRVQFIEGDIFDVLPGLLSRGERFDVILCLGIFYHIMDHHRLVKLMTAFRPELIILDTGLIDSDEPFIKLKTESTDHYLNAAESYAGQQEALVGIVSRGGIELLANSFGYTVRYEHWHASAFQDRSGLTDYFMTSAFGARRYTLYLEPRGEGSRI